METYHGYVRTTLDAIILFEACRLGMLPRVQRRLSDRERKAITSGSVFIWDEDEAGMRRWTDGKSWSASRVSGSFLTYREMEGKRLDGHDSGEEDHAHNSNDDEAAHSSAQDLLMSDGYRYKPNGLMKQSFSITTATNLKLHLISYFSRSDMYSTTLLLPSQDPKFKNLVLPKGLYPDHTFTMTSVPGSMSQAAASQQHQLHQLQQQLQQHQLNQALQQPLSAVSLPTGHHIPNMLPPPPQSAGQQHPQQHPGQIHSPVQHNPTANHHTGAQYAYNQGLMHPASPYYQAPMQANTIYYQPMLQQQPQAPQQAPVSQPPQMHIHQSHQSHQPTHQPNTPVSHTPAQMSTTAMSATTSMNSNTGPSYSYFSASTPKDLAQQAPSLPAPPTAANNSNSNGARNMLQPLREVPMTHTLWGEDARAINVLDKSFKI